jgi:hypothetical protein
VYSRCRHCAAMSCCPASCCLLMLAGAVCAVCAVLLSYCPTAAVCAFSAGVLKTFIDLLHEYLVSQKQGGIEGEGALLHFYLLYPSAPLNDFPLDRSGV